jgi:hypothetical protein
MATTKSSKTPARTPRSGSAGQAEASKGVARVPTSSPSAGNAPRGSGDTSGEDANKKNEAKRSAVDRAADAGSGGNEQGPIQGGLDRSASRLAPR